MWAQTYAQHKEPFLPQGITRHTYAAIDSMHTTQRVKCSIKKKQNIYENTRQSDCRAWTPYKLLNSVFFR